jgi:hypothetical protein
MRYSIRCASLRSPSAWTPPAPSGLGVVAAARVEDGASEDALLVGGGLDEHLEGGVRAAVGLQLVEPGARDLRDPCAEADARAQLRRRRQRPQVVVDELAARRVELGVGCLPPPRFEQTSGGIVDVPSSRDLGDPAASRRMSREPRRRGGCSRASRIGSPCRSGGRSRPRGPPRRPCSRRIDVAVSGVEALARARRRPRRRAPRSALSLDTSVKAAAG